MHSDNRRALREAHDLSARTFTVRRLTLARRYHYISRGALQIAYSKRATLGSSRQQSQQERQGAPTTPLKKMEIGLTGTRDKRNYYKWELNFYY
jgi:hypothetical protein